MGSQRIGHDWVTKYSTLGSYYWNSVSDMLWEFVRTPEMVTSVAQKNYNVLLGCSLKEAFWVWSSEEKLYGLIERQKHLPYCKDRKHIELWLAFHLKWKLLSNWVICANSSSFFLSYQSSLLSLVKISKWVINISKVPILIKYLRIKYNEYNNSNLNISIADPAIKLKMAGMPFPKLYSFNM